MKCLMDIQGYPNYLIYPDGRVFSKKRHIFLKQCKNTAGYLYVVLFKNGKGKNHTIHRLVAIHFIENPENLPFIDHISRDILDNSIENLRWVTYRGNSNNRTDQSELGCNITKRKYCNSIQFRIYLNGKRHYKSFKTLEECEKYKAEFIEKYKDKK